MLYVHIADGLRSRLATQVVVLRLMNICHYEQEDLDCHVVRNSMLMESIAAMFLRLRIN